MARHSVVLPVPMSPVIDDEAFAAADGVLQQLERVGVRCALEQILRIGRQAEGLLGEAVVFLVHGILSHRADTALPAFTIVGVSRTTTSRVTARSDRSSAVQQSGHHGRRADPRSATTVSLSVRPIASSDGDEADVRAHDGDRLSCTIPSSEICGTTVSTSAEDPGVTARTSAGSLFIATSSGAETTRTSPCAASAT